MIHCGIGCHAHTVDLFFRKMSAPAHLMDHWINRFFDHCILKSFSSSRLLCLNNTVDHISAKADLSVSCRTFCKDFSCFHIDQNCRYGCCTNIHCKSADDNLFSAVKNIINKHVVRSCTKDTFYCKIAFSQNIRQFSENCVRNPYTLQVHKFTESPGKPFHIRHGVVQSWRFHLYFHDVQTVL